MHFCVQAMQPEQTHAGDLGRRQEAGKARDWLGPVQGPKKPEGWALVDQQDNQALMCGSAWLLPRPRVLADQNPLTLTLHA